MKFTERLSPENADTPDKPFATVTSVMIGTLTALGAFALLGTLLGPAL